MVGEIVGEVQGYTKQANQELGLDAFRYHTLQVR